MDEAERCHELIYLAYGQVLARGTEADIIRAAGLDIWLLHGARAREAAARLQGHPAVAGISAFGSRYHITARDAPALPDALLTRQPAGLEDIFIHLLEKRRDTRFGDPP